MVGWDMHHWWSGAVPMGMTLSIRLCRIFWQQDRGRWEHILKTHGWNGGLTIVPELPTELWEDLTFPVGFSPLFPCLSVYNITGLCDIPTPVCAHRRMLKYSLTTFLTSSFFLQGQRIKVLINSPIMSSFWLFCYLRKHCFFCLDFSFSFFPFSTSFIFAWISSPKPFSCFSFGKIQFPLDINLISLRLLFSSVFP